MNNRTRGGNQSNQASGQKANNFKATWGKMLNYFRSYWTAGIIALMSAVIGTVLTLIGPDKLSELTDIVTAGIVTGIDMDAVRTIGFTLVGFYGLSGLLSLVQGLIMAEVTQRISQKLRQDLSQKINKLPIAYFDNNTTGDILSRMTNDIDTIAQSLNQSISTLVTATTMLVGSLIMMLTTNLIMTATAVLATLIGIGLMMLIMSQSQKYFSRQQNDLGAINGHIEEIYTNQTIVKVYNGEDDARQSFIQINKNLQTSGFRAQSLSGLMMPIMTFIGNFGYVAVCIVGAMLAFNGSISFGVIVAFIMYVRYFTQPLSQLAQAAQSLQSTAAAGERVFDMLESTEMEDESGKTAKLSTIEGNVEFSNVGFSYPGSDKTVIHDFSAKANAGEKIAIVGPTGAGKTTMINLLMRFYDVSRGDIKIDGVSTNELKREDVRSQFSMVLQDTWIFNGTVRENLVYSVENVSDEKVEEASRAVGLHHFITTMPDGYDTVLNDQVSLSEGQKQQITIARAMIADKPMLILDEATSSVDTRTELNIQNAMDKLMEGRTSFIIAHRLSTIKNADLILVMKDGDIIESGTHDDLLEQGTFYAKLYNSQFEAA
ncbi:ABC transporter ATP-binding protein [Facklamia tabacinasalis]|uniref:ABC transporter ATP-binding protein n=2 Tax=Ruoffia tabacinasalis TaxID=87458 RepID=A0ABS0LKZ7_9LACT|nr:ABC transporter ATP-binding protein [Ruoffia tabacinasalis]MBG9978119.1 ABC transporter ATP-binding protein [Ruoffia tabacinasalis]